MDKKEMFSVIDAQAQRFTDASDAIWGYAETAFEENQSAQTLEKLLKDEGFTIKSGLADIKTAFCASWGSGKPVIAFLGEFDALAGLCQKAGADHKTSENPGANGHGCGHNLLGAGALAAAVAFRDYLKASGKPGTVRYYGCPGEENGSGKAFMARAGLFDDVDAAITWHPGSHSSVLNQSSLANYLVAYKFSGISAHAAECPHLGRSALDAAELMNVGIQFLREHIISDARIHYAFTDEGGTAPNVVQASAQVLYMIRAPKNQQVQEIYERVNKVAQGAATMTETTVTIDFIKACSNLVPNNVLEGVMFKELKALGPAQYTKEDRTLCEKLFATVPESARYSEIRRLVSPAGAEGQKFLEDKVYGHAIIDAITPYAPSTICMSGSTDVGDVSWNVPTVQLWMETVPNSTPGHSWQIVTMGKTHMAHSAMLQAGKVMAGTAVELFEHPQLIEDAKAELARRLGNSKYHCAIPAEVKPRAFGGSKK